MEDELKDEAWIVLAKRKDGLMAALVKTSGNLFHPDADTALKALEAMGALVSHFEVRRVEVSIKEVVTRVIPPQESQPEMPLTPAGHAICMGWAEHELGWGSRPDGYFIYPTISAATEDTTTRLKRMREQEEGRGYGPDKPPSTYSAPDGEPFLIVVSEDIMAEIRAKGWACRTSLPFNVVGEPNKGYRPTSTEL